ncbi:hypothetical protein MKW92_019989 [Papaver armeniacum]|nr:hypothetical protein MKW92_019989 [Papaver armeniacum]
MAKAYLSLSTFLVGFLLVMIVSDFRYVHGNCAAVDLGDVCMTCAIAASFDKSPAPPSSVNSIINFIIACPLLIEC